jgi:hypothetical protein
MILLLLLLLLLRMALKKSTLKIVPVTQRQSNRKYSHLLPLRHQQGVFLAR